MRTDGELLTWGEGLVFVLSVWHTMNHSICCRAEHYETATDTSMIPVTCAYDEAYYMLLLKQSVVKIGGVAIAMEICRVSKLHPCSINHKLSQDDLLFVWHYSKEGMYHPKGEMKVSVMIVYVHKAWHQTEKSTIEPERYLWYIWYALPLKISIYYDIRERQGDEVVNAIDLYIDDRTLHETRRRVSSADTAVSVQIWSAVCESNIMFVYDNYSVYQQSISSGMLVLQYQWW